MHLGVQYWILHSHYMYTCMGPLHNYAQHSKLLVIYSKPAMFLCTKYKIASLAMSWISHGLWAYNNIDSLLYSYLDTCTCNMYCSRVGCMQDQILQVITSTFEFINLTFMTLALEQAHHISIIILHYSVIFFKFT